MLSVQALEVRRVRLLKTMPNSALERYVFFSARNPTLKNPGNLMTIFADREPGLRENLQGQSPITVVNFLFNLRKDFVNIFGSTSFLCMDSEYCTCI